MNSLTPKRQIFIKKAETGTFGKSPQQRSTTELCTYGIINLDKPKGPTSHQVSDMVQKILHITKAGHSGTLDPQVTGVQPVGIGRATRITEFLLTAPKEYICLMHLHKLIEPEILHQTLEKFKGKIEQLPPIKSAVKRQLRTREIYELEVLEIKDQDVLYRVKCQAGTYIRKICHDIGQELGCGAHMVQLRRTQAGPFTEKDSLVTLNDLEDAYFFYQENGNDTFLRYCIQPIENALTHIAKCWIFDTTIESVTHGRDVAVPGISKLENFRKAETVAVLTLQGELVCIGEALMSAVEVNTKEKGIAIKVQKVFMEPVIKPKEEKTE
ncbi:RNA-guided pseudouridylation complex pseudouridine synthase subunit Cbf5 [Candidatus Woesearchaeota archaeon]|nr:RNA-guided pseudouridylation complex pseudouridine synthase subunit Cbf5 [Candidatus Woesearchaeota archaeon]